MRILGIDPGLQTTGFGVVDVDGHKLAYVASGTIRTTQLALGDLPGRLKVLFDGISEVVARYQPDVATVEIVFVNVNPQSTLLLGQARGAAITALVARDLPVAEYTALQMKKAVVGHGRAAKSQAGSSGQELGKRLDFMIQELHREANTLGSKSSTLELSRISVDMKVLIEQMREQVQNIE